MTELVDYKKLAGDNYLVRDPEFKTGATLVYNTLGTFAIPSVHSTFEGFEGPPRAIKKELIREQVKKDNGKTKYETVERTTFLYREPFHTFKYFEALGSTYGMHEIINDRELFDGSFASIIDRWKTEPAYIEKMNALRSSNGYSYNSSTINGCAITIHANIQSDGEVSYSFKDQIKKDKYENDYIDIHIGEFHLMPNTPRNIFRCNLAYDIQFIEKGSDNFNSDMSKTAPMLTGAPKPKATEDSPVEFYFGTTRLVDESSRPKEFYEKDLNIRHPQYLEAGAQIRWKSMSEQCQSWIRIYDGLDLKRIMSKNVYKPGAYVCNSKVRVNLTKLTKLIKQNNPIPLSTFKLIIYPPSYNILAYDVIDKVSHPHFSMFIYEMDYIDFDVQRNFKSSGGFQYSIEIYHNDKETLLFRDSTSDDVERYIAPQYANILKYGLWYHHTNGNDLKTIGREFPEFSHTFLEYKGVKTEDYGKIRYYPNESLIKLIESNGGAYISITTYDGTKRE